MCIRVLKPRSEVAHYIPDWVRAFSEGKLRDGAVAEETFSLYYEPTTDTIQVTDTWRVPAHTVTFFVEEGTCWAIAARRETVYTAYQRGMPLRVQGDFKIRDMELIDEIMNSFYQTLKDQGKDMAALFVGV